MKLTVILFILVSALSISACGGSSSSSSDTTTRKHVGAEPGTTYNVAAASNGSVATASYDDGDAGIVNDGDLSSSYYWAGNIQNDYVDVGFDKAYNIYKFIIYTTATSTSDAKVQIEKASAGGVYTDISLLSDCYTLAMGDGKIDCVLYAPILATHIRFQITASTSVGTKQVYEVMAFGN